MDNLWHELPATPEPVDDVSIIYTVIEIPRGSRNKFEYDKEFGLVRLDRVLYSSIIYPGDYGFIPHTFYDDGDPLDVLVMVNQPTFPGCLIEARPVGLFRMMDKGEMDDKVLAVPYRDPLYADIHSLKDVPDHFLREVEHFFSVYKDLEGVRVQPIGWEDVDEAHARIKRGIEGYDKKYGDRG
ncbi:MAG: inorganic diphosphatase [Chloroflexi bacterium]|nr:inorganic diphosphatase [Chloroflexota bacterium]